jgi:C4-dicarboxylate transporter DctQ subunit
VKVGSHIGVDVFVKLFPKKAHRGFTLLAIALCLIYCGLFLYGGWMYVAKLKLIGIDLEDVEFPRWAATSVLVVGFALLAFRLLQLAVKVLRGESDGFHFTDEAEESMHIADDYRSALYRVVRVHAYGDAYCYCTWVVIYYNYFTFL